MLRAEAIVSAGSCNGVAVGSAVGGSAPVGFFRMHRPNLEAFSAMTVFMSLSC